jgi:phospholipid/cholesterol/gamma-HCH transport system substrate-binding protein
MAGHASRRRRGPSRRAAVRFTVFALITTLLTLYLALRIIGQSFGDHYSIQARFDNVSGLRNGNLVKVSGVPVGQVTEVKVVQGKALVRLSVDQQVRLPADSEAVIRWRDLIGTREVYLTPGQSTGFLRSGGEITRTESSVDLGSVINSLGPLIGSLDPTEINRVLQTFATALQGNEGNINQIVGNLNLLLTTFGSRSATIDQMIKDYKVVTDAVGQRDQEIAQTVQNLQSLAAAFNANRGVLTTALAHLRKFTGDFNSVTAGNVQQLSQVVTTTRQLLNIAHQHSQVLNGIVQGLPSALQALMSTQSGGHFARASLVCLNFVYTPTCPFPEVLPPAAAGSTSKLGAKDKATFGRLAGLLLLGAVNGGRS